MKRTLYLFMMVAGLILASCEKEEVGGTASQKLAGDWYVTVVAVDDKDSLIYSDADLFGLGTFQLLAYNASSNTDSIWIDDMGALGDFSLDFKTKLSVDLSKATFGSASDTLSNPYEENNVVITNGKILYGVAKTPSGMNADSIVFNVWFDSDTNPADYGYAKYRIAGYRRTGLTADEP